LALGLGHFYWDATLDWVRGWLQSSDLMQGMWGRMQGMAGGSMQRIVPALIVIVAVSPLIVVGSLLLVASFMSPALTALVARRRFPLLEKKQGGSLMLSIAWSLGSTLLALVALVISMPLWLVPPLILILPPLIWGWLTYRVMAFDSLSEHASASERSEIFRRHRMSLLAIGVMTGYLGAAPGIVWASGALFAAAFFILVPVAIWLYTLVFAFASLWFAHYCLAALEALRAGSDVAGPAPVPPASPLALPDDPNSPPV
jgi:hypothetical protein